MPARFRLIGVSEMAAKIRQIAREQPDRAASALLVEGERVMTDSKRNHVPVDLGTLRASGRVEPPKIEGKKISVQLAYGSAAAPYALAVHEDPSRHSPPTWNGRPVQFSPAGRGPKYLERPLRDALGGMSDRIARRLKL